MTIRGSISAPHTAEIYGQLEPMQTVCVELDIRPRHAKQALDKLLDLGYSLMTQVSDEGGAF